MIFMQDLIAQCEAKVLAGQDLSIDEGEGLLAAARDGQLESLLGAADRVRRHFLGDEVHLCSIVNAKSGRCSEDCGFCAQSVRFQTGIEEFALIDGEQAKAAAREAATNGSEALGLVAAWRGLSAGTELDNVCDVIRDVSEQGQVHCDASLGLIDDPQVAERLAEAGLHTYNHNLESARSHFESTVGSHSYDDRLRTLRLVREAGMSVCSGGIVGMGESPRQRVELAVELRELDPDMVPLNFLNPIEGTPLGDGGETLSAEEALATLSVFRLMLPRHHIMVAGGREVVLGEMVERMYEAGASATMVGDYLTTGGTPAADDLALLDRQGLQARGRAVQPGPGRAARLPDSPRPGPGQRDPSPAGA
ncbi:MAG: biotin synthase BioB [Planctomycetota bacterium]|nr:MAG: biotin synthase BioB [Planctomycetota bacterium]